MSCPLAAPERARECVKTRSGILDAGSTLPGDPRNWISYPCLSCRLGAERQTAAYAANKNKNHASFFGLKIVPAAKGMRCNSYTPCPVCGGRRYNMPGITDDTPCTACKTAARRKRAQEARHNILAGICVNGHSGELKMRGDGRYYCRACAIEQQREQRQKKRALKPPREQRKPEIRTPTEKTCSKGHNDWSIDTTNGQRYCRRCRIERQAKRPDPTLRIRKKLKETCIHGHNDWGIRIRVRNGKRCMDRFCKACKRQQAVKWRQKRRQLLGKTPKQPCGHNDWEIRIRVRNGKHVTERFCKKCKQESARKKKEQLRIETQKALASMAVDSIPVGAVIYARYRLDTWAQGCGEWGVDWEVAKTTKGFAA